MEFHNRYDGVSPRVVRNIRYQASRLARSGRLPGMDKSDIEQDLMLDLLQRQPKFDAARSSFDTFADRVIKHRVATLMAPTSRLRAERSMVSLDLPAAANEEYAPTLAEVLPESAGLFAHDGLPSETAVGLVRDVQRFLSNLSPVLKRYAGVLAADNVSTAARDAGLHRSTIYERLSQLRSSATAAGLHEYFCSIPTAIPQRR